MSHKENVVFGLVTVHRDSFCAGAHPTDVRMTTRFKPDDLTEGLTGAIHETGHALYEQNRNLKYDGLPVNQVDFSMHHTFHRIHH